MKYFLHDNDLPREVEVGNSIAIDTETTGLNLTRDRLCLIQICTQNKQIHLIKISKKSNSPVISEILSNENFIKQKDKMPSVRRCLNFYENFENAHRDCIKSIQINPPITKKDSLKSI